MAVLQLLAGLEVPVVLLLLAASLGVLPLLWQFLHTDWRGDPLRRGWLGAVVAAAVARAIAPHAIVTMYIGYQLAEQAMRLATESRYGIGSQALYHLLYAVLPRDHAVLWWTNSVLGVLSIPVWSTLAGRLLRDRRAAVVFAWLWALLPLYIKNDNSDANNVPLHFWMGCGLLAWSEWLARGRLEALVAATPLLALTLVSRPEQPLLLPVLWLGVTVALRPPPGRWRQPGTWLAPLLVGLLGVPHVLHVAGAVQTLQERDSLPGFAPHALADLPALLTSRMNTLLEPRLYPVILLPAALMALWPRETRRDRLVLLVIAVVAVATYSLDLCRANMARVHVLGSLFATMLAAGGLVAAADRWGRGRLVVALAVVVPFAVPTALNLWQPTNEDAEERLIRTAVAALPHASIRFVRLADDDGSHDPTQVWRTHRHFPDYLVQDAAPDSTVESVGSFLRNPSFDRPVYAFLGYRCYAEFREDGVAPPHGDNQQPACQKLHEGFALQPVVQEDAHNFGDVWLNYYGDATTLRVGLYRVMPRPQ